MSSDFPHKKIAVLGSTGSIGRQTMSVCEHAQGAFEITALAAYDEVEAIAAQARSCAPQLVALADKSKYNELKAALAGLSCRIAMGEEGVCEAASLSDTDTVVAAISGIAGLKPTCTAIAAGKNIALANKEVLVTAGELVMPAAAHRGAALLPVDSEHSAVWQCLHGRKEEVKRLIITASGGAFYGYSAEELEKVTPTQALRHPTWNMGAKITVDSATLMNKGFEIIEAHHLFAMPYERILPVIHRESIVHSMVEYCDGAVLALLSEPDMRLPIQYALTYPQRLPSQIKALDLTRARTLSFEPCRIADFPCLEMALEAGRRGGALPVALNAANEVLVQRFLQGGIGFNDIARVLEKVLRATEQAMEISLENILRVDAETRALTLKEAAKACR